MNVVFFYFPWVISLLAAAGTIFWVNHVYRTKPAGRLAALLRHHDHVWFGVLLLLVPSIVDQFLLLYRPSYRGSFYLMITAFDLLLGIVYGVAGCWFASPGKRPERFNAWMALAVAIALILVRWVVWRVWMFRFLLARPGTQCSRCFLKVFSSCAISFGAASGKRLP